MLARPQLSADRKLLVYRHLVWKLELLLQRSSTPERVRERGLELIADARDRLAQADGPKHEW
jgi:hypothetical protein